MCMRGLPVYLYMYHMCMQPGTLSGRSDFGAAGSGVTAECGLTCGLGTELRSTERAVCAPNH